MSRRTKEMLSTLLRPGKKPYGRVEPPSAGLNSHPNTPSPGPAQPPASYLGPPRHAVADFTEADDDDDEDDDGDHEDHDEHFHSDSHVGQLPTFHRAHRNGAMRGTEGRQNGQNIMPLFSTTYLDSLPVYHIVHAIRIIVQTRCETTLTWEQLRSPQVSSFLTKPMQQQIRTQHFTRATLYSLMANCLQFGKEAQLYPGNAGVSSTRAKVCELLALKMLKEYNTRELIDALSYDFYPLQGLVDLPSTLKTRSSDRSTLNAVRSSTLEVAIRASAKHFLSHPLVVQQLEAIWNGAISFYSAADYLHRAPQSGHVDGNKTNGSKPQSGAQPNARTPLLRFQSAKEDSSLPVHEVPVRRTVSLYDPRNASPLKLSRLRVPRYRQFLSTCSLFVLICLFLAVLIQRSSRITTLELVFWFWSAGFMLDELVGFNEQGFSLYMMSFWNLFDMGILLILIVYYCMRVYGMFLVSPQDWNDKAYDVLAANAILLLPRIFSVLDHYQYFSQLLIAFRIMAVELAAVFILILISCSGFFVFFTLSRNQNDPYDVAYKIFQILMGFTPAAWDAWPEFDLLGKVLMVFFLIICHFVVVTILITVLTNSFMAIASNANQEHQFLFAINTISMVKNDALFSYIAPSNILAWILTPLRYVMPLREFVWLNRAVIKVTHCPLLFCIFLYERFFLASAIYEPTDLVEHHGRTRTISFADPASRTVTGIFSPNIRAREESVAGLQRDHALEEVFRRPPDASTLRLQRRHERRKSQTAIRNWMDQNDHHDDDDDDAEGTPLAHWPTMESRISRGSIAPEWQRRLSSSKEFPRRFRQLSDVRSAASDPADLISHNDFVGGAPHRAHVRIMGREQPVDPTGADGDDELVTNDEDEEPEDEDKRPQNRAGSVAEDYFNGAKISRGGVMPSSSSSSRNSKISNPPTTMSPRSVQRRQGAHSRTLSTNTILYAPQEIKRRSNSNSSSEGPTIPRSRPKSNRVPSTTQTPPAKPNPGYRSPRKTIYTSSPASRPRPIPSKSVPDRSGLMSARDPRLARLSSIDMDMNSDASVHQDANELFGAVPSSFATQMALATGQLKGLVRGGDRDNADRMSRLVLARMKTLEESFADVVKEMRVFRSGEPTAHNSGDDVSSQGQAIIEVAGHDKKTSRGGGGGSGRQSKTTSRPTTSAAPKGDATGSFRPTVVKQDIKGKGRATAKDWKPDDDEHGSEPTQH